MTADTAIVRSDAPAQVPTNLTLGAMEHAIGLGDLSKLTPADRTRYVGAICQSVGLNPLTRPLDYITLQGKLTLYANKGCAEQLRSIHGVSCSIVERSEFRGTYMVRVRATTKDGRSDEATGVVVLHEGAKGEALANAMMKAETKAKRRATLSLCGLGIIDESELDTVDARPAVVVEPGTSAADVAASLSAESGQPEVIDVEPETPKPAPKSSAKATEQTKKAFAAVVSKWSGVHRDDLADACRRVAAKFGVADLSGADDDTIARLTLEATAASAQHPYLQFVS